MKKILISSICLFCIVFIGCKEKTDIEFAIDFFEKLAEGKASVMDDIDWENFSGTGFDIGGKLKSISDNSEKKNLKKSFINSFSDSFKKSGLEIQNTSNWVIEDTNNIRTIVSCEIGQDNFLYLVILRKIDNTRKVSSVMVSDRNLKLPSEFCSSIKYDPFSALHFLTFFPPSLINKYIISKEKKDAELIKKKRYTKRIGISHLLPSEYLLAKTPPEKTIEYFDTCGYLIKTIRYDWVGRKEELLKRTLIRDTSDVKLIDEKKRLYKETYFNEKYYYTLIDSMDYKFHKIIKTNHTSIYKYDKNNNLLNIAFVNDVGYYNGLFFFFYDSLENLSGRLIYQLDGTLIDTIYNTKYDSSGNIEECVRYYSPGTFDKNCFLFYKCNSRYDLKGKLTEKMYSAIFTVADYPDKITYSYNSGDNIVKIYYYGWFGPLFDEGGVDRDYIFNDEGLLIETVDTGGDIIIATDVTKYTYE
jgi:hypothetical protein